MWTISTTVAMVTWASVRDPQALPHRRTKVGRSIFPRNRLTWRTRLLTQERSVSSSR